MRILHVLAPALAGGLERVVADLTSAQGERGNAVLVLAIGSAPPEVAPFLDSLEPERVTGRPLLVPARAYRKERAAVAALCREWRPHVIHTHGYRPDVLDAGPGRRTGAAAVSTVHGFVGGGVRNRFYEWLQCRAYRSFDAVVAVAGSVADVLYRRGVPPERVCVVRNAVREPDFLEAGEARRRLRAPEGAFHLGWVGRLGPEKGPDVFVEALAGLERRGVDPFHATMVGTGVLGDALRERVQELGLGARVRLAGLVHGASRLFTGFDAVVLSSRTEGTPMVLLEAMAARVPVVATRVGGIPAVVGPEEALLVPADDPEALADALALTASDPEGAARRAAAARARFEAELDVGGWVRAYGDVYARAIERRGAGRDAPAASSSVLT